MNASIILLLAVTVLYAGYNLLVKVSSGYVPAHATTTIAATITLQLGALAASLVFVLVLLLRGNATFALNAPAFWWAAAGGIAIGVAEILYFYLFRGAFGNAPVSANLAIPIVVGGTILLATVGSWLFLSESMTWPRLIGAGMIIAGVAVMFLDNTALSAGRTH